MQAPLCPFGTDETFLSNSLQMSYKGVRGLVCTSPSLLLTIEQAIVYTGRGGVGNALAGPAKLGQSVIDTHPQTAHILAQHEANTIAYERAVIARHKEAKANRPVSSPSIPSTPSTLSTRSRDSGLVTSTDNSFSVYPAAGELAISQSPTRAARSLCAARRYSRVGATPSRHYPLPRTG